MRGVDVIAFWLVLSVVAGDREKIRYGFYRGSAGDDGGTSSADTQLNTRRVFGGEAAELTVFPAVCALLDRYWSTRCSCSIVSARWAVTAAHCVSPRIAYVKYNARRPSAVNGDVAAVHYLYIHPGYKVIQEDEGRGMDVTLLYHDVGLVRTRVDMVLTNQPKIDPLHAMRLYNPVELKNERVKVLGFGRTERLVLGEELFVVQLRLVFCERGAWFHCVCGVPTGSDPRGVCSGDSGGPVIYNGAQVGVTSMGPMECMAVSGPAIITSVGNATVEPPASLQVPASGATSVFTSLYNYAELINATIHDTEQKLRMRMIAGAARPFECRAVPALATLASCVVFLMMPER